MRKSMHVFRMHVFSFIPFPTLHNLLLLALVVPFPQWRAVVEKWCFGFFVSSAVCFALGSRPERVHVLCFLLDSLIFFSPSPPFMTFFYLLALPGAVSAVTCCCREVVFRHFRVECLPFVSRMVRARSEFMFCVSFLTVVGIDNPCPSPGNGLQVCDDPFFSWISSGGPFVGTSGQSAAAPRLLAAASCAPTPTYGSWRSDYVAVVAGK